MKKVIYVYRRIDTEENTYKIGKADQRVNQEADITIDKVGEVRISEQLTAATYGKYEVVKTYDISHVESSTAVEHAIHNGIGKAGYSRLERQLGEKKGSTEWFDFDDANEGQVLDLVKSLVEKYAGASGLATYIPRGYQSHVKNQILEAISNNGKIIGAELAARFGKTVWTLDVFKTLSETRDFQYLLLPAYVLTAHASFQKELRSFSDFDDMMFISDKDLDFEEKVRNNTDKKLVIATSLHTPEESLGKYKVVADLDKSKKIAFIDEADFGAHTESSKVRIDLLDVDTKVIMTGTAIERALAGYDVDAIVKWSYFDMLLLKDGSHPMLDKLSEEERQAAINSCAVIVRPNLFKMSMPNAAEIQKNLPDVLQTKWSKLLEDVDKSSMILSMIVRAMFKNDNSNITELTSLQLGSVTPTNVTMIFGGFSNKKEHGKFVKLLKSTLGEDFVVLKVNGDETSNRKAEEYVETAIAKAKRLGKKVIIVSKDMASRSFSIPEIDTVFLMYDQGLRSQTVQKSSRVFTPGSTYSGEVKQRGTIVSLSLDSNRLETDPIDLYVSREAERINDGSEALQESIRRICQSVNIFQNDLTFGSIKVEEDEYAEEMLKRSSILKNIIATLSLERINPNDFPNAILANRSANPNRRNEENVSVDISNVQTAVIEREEVEREPTTPNEEEQFIENVLALISNITALKEIVGFSRDSLLEIISEISDKGLEREVEEFYGLTFESIKRLIETEALPTRLLNTVLKTHTPEVLEI